MEISQEAGWLATRIELIRSAEGEIGLADRERPPLAEGAQFTGSRGETDHYHVVEDEATEPHDGHGLGYLQQTARDRKNVFAALWRR